MYARECRVRATRALHGLTPHRQPRYHATGRSSMTTTTDIVDTLLAPVASDARNLKRGYCALCTASKEKPIIRDLLARGVERGVSWTALAQLVTREFKLNHVTYQLVESHVKNHG